MAQHFSMAIRIQTRRLLFRLVQATILMNLVLSVPAQDNANPAAERELLDLASQSRTRAQVGPLKMENCLVVAARRHAVEMAERQQLSHQFSGEPALSDRVAATCSLHLDEVAENVAFANSAAEAHDGFMKSPPHRENLLHPSYNVMGVGVVQRGSNLFVVEDFGHDLPSYSTMQASELIAGSIAKTREAAHQPALKQEDSSAVQSEACDLARADSLKSPSAHSGARYVLRFTTMEPQTLPAAGAKAIADGTLSGFAEGACFARSASYPNGVYWVVLELY